MVETVRTLFCFPLDLLRTWWPGVTTNGDNVSHLVETEWWG